MIDKALCHGKDFFGRCAAAINFALVLTGCPLYVIDNYNAWDLIRWRCEAERKTYIPPPPMNITGLTLAEAILRGRDRARQNAT